MLAGVMLVTMFPGVLRNLIARAAAREASGLFAAPAFEWSWFFAPMTDAQRLRATPNLVYAVLDFALAAAFVGLWRAAPDFRVFRSMGIYLTMFGTVMLWDYIGGHPSRWFLSILTAPVLTVIAAQSMRVDYRIWRWVVWPYCLLIAAIGWFAMPDLVRSSPFELTQIVLGLLILQAYRGGTLRDRRIAAVFLGLFCVRWTASPILGQLTHIPAGLTIGSWRWSFNSAAMILLGAATLVLFARDLMEDRREKQRLASELAAGRAVQQVLVAEKPPTVPGFEIHTVYKPFGEVGGDFFQILPLAGGGALIAIGDVSGKGMQAAMMVSLLVGTLHAVAESTTSPGQILSALNRLAQAHSHGGFTTCLMLRMDVDGGVTFANAGHISPYRNGTEMDCENGLPLGLVTAAAYAESRFELGSEHQLTLVTDGVVEARNEDGELFGFARTAGCAHQTADAIAKAAHAFGQDDDITVLTVRRSAVVAV
jgi:hypothetical protein